LEDMWRYTGKYTRYFDWLWIFKLIFRSLLGDGLRLWMCFYHHCESCAGSFILTSFFSLYSC
jgi:hypothetical protein